MFALLTSWVKNIILIVLFASFLELLLPNSSLQRFIRVIMGLLIMLAILNPAIDIVQGNWTMGDIPAVGTNSQKQADIVRSTNKITEDRDRLAREIYKRDIAKQIRALVIAFDGVSEVRVAIDLEEKSLGGAGAIHKISLFIKPGNVTKQGAVEKVSVGEAQHPELVLKDTVRNKIKGTITELYQLRGEQVDIKPWN